MTEEPSVGPGTQQQDVQGGGGSDGTAAEIQRGEEQGGMGEARAREVINEMSAVEQLALLQMEEESLAIVRRQLQELCYKLTIEEITLKQAKQQQQQQQEQQSE